ncbi:hypothetical protein PG993_012154 [Apiospora rasikravindrae]|uniref:Uncharacterized protein n=1 Tax=Apiospora rasikravindrae TaxID=990691 RepID=A0ABR1S1S8_9PEZI
MRAPCDNKPGADDVCREVRVPHDGDQIPNEVQRMPLNGGRVLNEIQRTLHDDSRVPNEIKRVQRNDDRFPNEERWVCDSRGYRRDKESADTTRGIAVAIWSRGAGRTLSVGW